jgi:signal-transduction protein with cAMP-binding, CBS, and nucleotidyltransferase domain
MSTGVPSKGSEPSPKILSEKPLEPSLVLQEESPKHSFTAPSQPPFQKTEIKEVILEQTPQNTLERTYIQIVENMRSYANDALLKPESNTVEIQEKISGYYDALIGALIQEAIKKVGPPPTAFAVLGLGSLSRNEASPYSDLDFAFLIKEDTSGNRLYFNKLTSEMQLLVANLQETHPKKRGIAFCMGGLNPPYLLKSQPLGSSALIDTPQNFAEWMKEETPPENFDRRSNNASSAALEKSVLQTHLMYGDQDLFDHFQKARLEILKAPALNLSTLTGEQNTVQEAKGLKVMKGEASGLEKGHVKDTLDLKSKIVRPIQNTVMGLCLFYGIDENNTSKAIDRLQKEGHLNKDIAHYMQKIYQLAYRLRAQAHLTYKKEIDEVKIHGTEIEKFLSPKDIEELQQSQAILLDIKSKSDIFVKSNGNKNIFI